MNIWLEAIVPLSGVVVPAIVTFISSVYNRWSEGRKFQRNSQFDKVDEGKRLATFRRIKQLKCKDNITCFEMLEIKALYEGIGIRYPIAVSHKILEFIADKNIPFNDPLLNSFLRVSGLLNITEEDITQPSSERKKKRREILIAGAIMIAAIIYGFLMSVPGILSDIPGVLGMICFVAFFLCYLFLFILIISAVVTGLYDIQCAKKFWKKISPFLNN